MIIIYKADDVPTLVYRIREQRVRRFRARPKLPLDGGLYYIDTTDTIAYANGLYNMEYLWHGIRRRRRRRRRRTFHDGNNNILSRLGLRPVIIICTALHIIYIMYCICPCVCSVCVRKRMVGQL